VQKEFSLPMAAAGLRLPHLLGWDSFIRYA
jgi:hypothetical protein